MTELSGFSTAQPLAQIGPQSLRLPTSIADVCACESNCGASQILKGLAQIVGSGITNLIQIEVKNAPEGVKVDVIPWKKDGVERNGVAIPGGWVAVDGSECVGMGNAEYASRWSNNMALEWDSTVAGELVGDKAVLTFAQPTSANRPFTYAVTCDGSSATIVDKTETGDAIALTLDTGAGTYFVHVATQYQGVGGVSASVTVSAPEPAPEPNPPQDPPE